MNPVDLWSWVGLAGDLVDLVPFVTGVGELPKTVEITINASDDVNDVVKTARKLYNAPNAPVGIKTYTGAYEITYASGKNYVGKGGYYRATRSANRYVKKYGDRVVSVRWRSARDAREAFIQEYLMQKKRSVLDVNRNAQTYNKIWSPGKRYYR